MRGKRDRVGPQRSLHAGVALSVIAVAGSIALLASARFTSWHPNVLAGGVAMACAATTLVIECIMIQTRAMNLDRPSARSLAGGGTIFLVFAAAAVHLASPVSSHRLTACLVTLLLLGLLLILALIGMLGWIPAWHAVSMGIACLVLFALASCAEWAAAPHADSHLAAVLPVTAGGGFVSALLVKLVRSRIEDEAAVTPLDLVDSDNARPAASGRVTAALGQVALVTLSAFVSLLTLTYVATVAAKINPNGGFTSADRELGTVGAAVAVVGVVLWLFSRQVPAGGGHVLLFRGCCAVLIVPAIALLVTAAGQPFSALPAVVSLIVGLWNVNSVIGNVCVLQLRPVTGQVIVVAACAFLLGASITYWALVSAVRSSHGARSFAVSSALVIIVVLLHILLISLVPVTALGSAPHVTEFTIQHNLFQDSLSISAILLVIEWPVEFLRASSGQWWLAITLSAGLVPLFSSGFLWAISSNRDHLRRQARRLLGDDSARVLAIAEAEGRVDRRLGVLWRAAHSDLSGLPDERFIRGLSAHIKNQNLLAYLAVLAAIVGTVTIAFESLQDSSWINRLAALSRLQNPAPPSKP